MYGEEFGKDGKNGGAIGGGKRSTRINWGEMMKDHLGEWGIR